MFKELIVPVHGSVQAIYLMLFFSQAMPLSRIHHQLRRRAVVLQGAVERVGLPNGIHWVELPVQKKNGCAHILDVRSRRVLMEGFTVLIVKKRPIIPLVSWH